MKQYIFQNDKLISVIDHKPTASILIRSEEEVIVMVLTTWRKEMAVHGKQYGLMVLKAVAADYGLQEEESLIERMWELT